MKSPRRFLVLAVSTVVISTSLQAQGPTPATPGQLEEAQRRYQRARELYEENNFNAALVEMRRSYELSRSYKLLYDIGQICYQTHDYPCALQSFGRFLQEGKQDIAGPRREEVQAELTRLKGRVASVRVTAAAGAEIQLDDTVIGTAPLAEPVLVGAGRHRLSARQAGRELVVKAVEVAGGDALEVNLPEASTERPPGAAPASGSPATSGPSAPPVATAPSRSIPWVGWAITGGLAVGAGVVGALALSSSSTYQGRLDTFGARRDQVSDAHDRTRTLALVTDVLLGATAVAGGVSLYFTLAGGSNEPPTRVTTTIGPRGLLLRGSF